VCGLIVGESQSQHAVWTHDLCGPIEEHKAEGLRRLQHQEHGALAGRRAANGAGVDLEVREQVVHEDDQVLLEKAPGIDGGRMADRKSVSYGPSGGIRRFDIHISHRIGESSMFIECHVLRLTCS
jgi:hypothetical protein